MMTDPLDLDRLVELAEAATPGPWVAQSRDDGASDPWWIDTHAYPDGPEPVWAPPQYPVNERDAAYIAAVSPSTVLALVRDLREAREAFDAYRDEHNGWCAAALRDKP